MIKYPERVIIVADHPLHKPAVTSLDPGPFAWSWVPTTDRIHHEVGNGYYLQGIHNDIKPGDLLVIGNAIVDDAGDELHEVIHK